MLRFILICIVSAIFSGCGSNLVPIDQVPMYGGMNRKANSTLKEADGQLIHGATQAFGSRKAASRAWANKAFRDYAEGRSRNGIRRFNQAWLLDPSNPEVYWGFALWYRHLGERERAVSMMKKAYSMGLREAEFLETYREIIG